MYTENNTTKENEVVRIPVTEEEAFKLLDEIYPLEEKQMAIEKKKDEFVADEHFELGQWIRNNWIYPPDNADNETVQRYIDCNAMLTGTKPGEPDFCHPDEVSSRFLEKYYDHLKEFVAFKNDPIPVRRKPVKCHHCGSKVLRIQYGYPSHEMMEASERGEILLGGCIVSEDSPDYACPICGQSYCRVQFYDD